uniref:FTH domain-containing protein n=1 Tax=Panagrellus redivivus TaxID=6233 RepID=A0A7E4ZZ95_PANRE
MRLTSNVSNAINYTDLLTAIPDLRAFTTNYHSTNWMAEILHVEKHSLRRLHIIYTRFEQCDHFDFNELLAFIRKQRTAFDLIVTLFVANCDSFFLQLKQFLDQRLISARILGNTKRTNVTINYNFVGYTWYVPLNEDILELD